jgi:hypothetical protein
MQKITCPQCNGNGLYNRPSVLGTMCFPCAGTGKVNVRKARAPKAAPVLSPTRKIADIVSGDPTKIDRNNTTFMNFLGLTDEELDNLCNLWNQGIREVPR